MSVDQSIASLRKPLPHYVKGVLCQFENCATFCQSTHLSVWPSSAAVSGALPPHWSSGLWPGPTGLCRWCPRPPDHTYTGPSSLEQGMRQKGRQDKVFWVPIRMTQSDCCLSALSALRNLLSSSDSFMLMQLSAVMTWSHEGFYE